MRTSLIAMIVTTLVTYSSAAPAQGQAGSAATPGGGGSGPEPTGRRCPEGCVPHIFCQNSSCEPEQNPNPPTPQCPRCEICMAPITQPGPNNDALIGLVSPHEGAVLEHAVDFALGSKGDPVVQWRHWRMYDQTSYGPGETVQGHNWLHTYLQDLTLDGSTPADDDVIWRATAHRSYRFANDVNYSFSANTATLGMISHEHAGDPADTYRIEFPSGAILVFFDFDYATGALQGKLSYIEDRFGNRLTLSYDGSGNIDYITDPSGHYFRYTYVSGGSNDGKLDYIRVFKDSSTADAGLIARIEFTYYDSGQGYDAGCGTVGDLILVTVKTHKTGETGTTFSISKTTHYRYWADADDEGNDHEIKMILNPEHYQRAQDNLPDQVLEEEDADVDDYATYQLEYDNAASARATQMIAASGSGGCGGCGGGGGGGAEGTYDFSYATQANTDRNGWAIRCKVERKVGAVVLWTYYADVNDWGEVWKAVLITDDSDHSKPLWGTEYTRDANGRITSIYSASAITDYNTSTHAFTYDNDGAVTDYTYDSNSKRLASMRVRKYSEAGSAARYVGLWEYVEAGSTFDYRTHYVLDKSYAYPDETTSPTDGSRLTTTYEYVFYTDSGDLDDDGTTDEDNDRPMVVKVTTPTVDTGENGPNVAPARYSYIDTTGRTRWTKDEEGAVHYQSYHDLSGQLAYSVRDVYTGTTEGAILPAGITAPDNDFDGTSDDWVDWSGAAPKDLGASPAYDFQTTGSSSDYVKLQSKRLMDLQGRLRRTIDGTGRVDYTAYLDDETRTYSAWDASTDKPLLPLMRRLMDEEGRTTDVIVVNVSDYDVDGDGTVDTLTLADPPTGSEALTEQLRWVSWTATSYDSSLRPSTVKAYHAIPSSGSGSDGTNYYTTTYDYDSDGTANTTVQIEDPEDGYIRTTYNASGQRIKLEMTATESTGNPTSWKTITEWFYDQATPGTGSSLGGNGNLTQVKSYYADASSNSTAFTYDWRGRRLLTSPPLAPFTLAKYDNMDRMVAVGTYSSAPSASADPTSLATNRVGLSETVYNKAGRVYKATRWDVDATDGSTSNDLVTDYYYDRSGRQVAVDAPSSGVSVTKYDGAGRVVETQTCVDLGATIYSSGAFDYTSDNEIVEKTVNVYEWSSNTEGGPVTIDRYELKSGQNSYTGSTLRTQQRVYYDDAGRRIQTTNVGSTAGGLTGGMGGSFSISAYDGGSPESRSDTNLVTTWTYTADGRLQQVADPDNVVTRYEYDDLGRRTGLIEDYGIGGLGRYTTWTYNGNSDTTLISAENAGDYDGDSTIDNPQQTGYTYDHAVSSRWVTKIAYPDINDDGTGNLGEPSPKSDGWVTFTYHHDGTVATRTDQVGSVLTYDYDTLRRKTHELLSAGSGVDTAVLQLATAYDTSGRVSTLTSRDSATKDAGSVVNQVVLEYDGLGQLTKDYQEYNGAKDVNTLFTGYTYDISPDGTNNRARLSYITYPNGRDLYVDYDSHSAAGSTLQNEISDQFSRVAQLTDSSGNAYLEYTFTGLGRMVGRQSPNNSTNKGNDTFLDYDADGTADHYGGLDQFGRVVSQLVTDSGAATTRDDIQYQANRDGAPQFAEGQPAVTLGRSSLYTYDDLSRLTQADVGRLNGGRTDILTEWSDPTQIVYTMDILGNITTLNRKNSGVSANETRTYNATNELLTRAVTGESKRLWVLDDFTDNDTTGWATADADGDGTVDGSWSAGSGALSCAGVASITGSPDGGTGSILLIDGEARNDIRISCDITLNTGCDNAGIVFGYIDGDNFWVTIYSLITQTRRTYQVASGTWTQRTSSSESISAGTPFTAVVRTGASLAGGYNGPLAAGQYGLWCSDSSNNSIDDFEVRDQAGPFVADARWFSNYGDVQIDESDDNVLTADADLVDHAIVRRGSRAGQYEMTFKFKANGTTHPGCLARWLSPSDWLAVGVNASDGKPRLYSRSAGAPRQTEITSATALSLTNGNWYTAKLTVDDDGSGGDRLRFWVDTDDDGTWSDEAEHFADTSVIDAWPAGYVGLFVAGSGAATEFDDVTMWMDTDADGTIDEQQFADDFDSNQVTLTYDDNGNLTYDSVFTYVYDGWNRLRKVQRVAAGPTTTDVALYEYFADNRRSEKIVQNSGAEAVENDGGDTTVRFYYGGINPRSRWNILETRNGSDQATFQYVWGTQYIDELVLIDKNLAPEIDVDCDADVLTVEEDDTDDYREGDSRYLVHQNANGDVVALTDYDPAGSTEGAVVERYSYTPYGEVTVLNGVGTTSREFGNVRLTSSVGVHMRLLVGSDIDPPYASTTLSGDSGETWCDPQTGTVQQRVDEFCAGDCVQRHENVHKNDIRSCCTRYGQCVRKHGLTLCQARWNAWLDKNRNYFECRAWRDTRSCLKSLIFWGCDVFGTISCECCDDLRRKAPGAKELRDYYCGLAGARFRCPFNHNGDIRTIVLFGELP